jgi:hypothetical protein
MINVLKIGALFLLLMGQWSFASASIMFDLRGQQGIDVDGFNSAPTTVDGLTATLTASPAAFNGHDLLLNRTLSGFGVNVEGLLNTGGCTNEDSDGIDDGCVFEEIIISLSENVLLESVSVSSFGSSDVAEVAFENPSLLDFNITHTGTTDSINQMVGGLDNRWLIAWRQGNGFSFDSFTVSRVPEPSIIALFGLGLLGLGIVRRRKHS